MRDKKEIVHDLFELRSQLLFIKDISEKMRIKDEIDKIRKELFDVLFEENKNKRGK